MVNYKAEKLWQIRSSRLRNKYAGSDGIVGLYFGKVEHQRQAHHDMAKVP